MSGSNVTLCWVRNKSRSRKSTGKLYGGAVSLNGVWEAAMYTTSSQIVPVLFSAYLPCFFSPSLSGLNTHFRAIRECQLKQTHWTIDGGMNIDLTHCLAAQSKTLAAVVFELMWAQIMQLSGFLSQRVLMLSLVPHQAKGLAKANLLACWLNGTYRVAVCFIQSPLTPPLSVPLTLHSSICPYMTTHIRPLWTRPGHNHHDYHNM